MEKLDESRRYKWSTSATNLLVSIWSHELVQNKLKLSSRNQPVWESIGRYMREKGFNVTGIQCRTRIKNMLCSYYEAVRKNDRSYIEPYFDLFKKVVSNRNSTKKDSRKKHDKGEGIEENDIEVEFEVSSDTSIDEIGEPTGENQTAPDMTYNEEYLDVSNQEVQVNTIAPENELLQTLERVLTKTIETQTKVISDVMKHQCEIIEKLLASEREKIEAILLVEQKSRKQLEERIDKLFSRLETNAAPQLTYVGPIIESRENEVL